ncbi:MAG: NAD(+) diphosphatase [Labilithrix sp.]|nr:NAD(+) diphosphatase [Labilithrix sp.]MCW5813274.1 NAD(+) diphosphatase [Labilithrix sp.]
MNFVPQVDPTHAHARRTWFVVHPKGLVARRDGERIVFPSDEDVAALGLDAKDAHRLGSLDDTDALVVPIAGRIEAPFELFALRALAAMLDASLFGVAGRAMHTADWLTTSRFCGRCGTKTAPHDSERAMACPTCRLHLYPRISPAIITLVRKGDLALLASNAKFPGVFYSTLAGFAEIGESLEETLVREVREESGVTVGDVRYFGSQPWPFPNSLMIAFTAEWRAGEIAIDPTELSDAKWFAIDDLPMIPPPLSIARQLIDAWIADVRARRSGASS